MSLVSLYSSSVDRARSEVVRYQQARSQATQDKARLSSQIVNEQRRMSSTSCASTMRSCASNIERYQRQMSECDRKIAEADKKIAQAQSRLSHDERCLGQEQVRESERRQRELDSQMQAMRASVADTGMAVGGMRSEIAKLKKQANKIKVLFLSANAVDTGRLCLDEEVRSIQEMLRKSDYRDSIDFVTRWAARPMDLLQAINEVSPAIVHFSGHGTPTGELAFQAGDGKTKLVTPDAMAAAIAAAADSVRVVLFNACFSKFQAEAVVRYVDAAIGMKISIGDGAARIFSCQFYSAIGFGRSLSDAFKQATAALMLERTNEEDIPVLLTKPGVDLEKLYFVRSEV